MTSTATETYVLEDLSLSRTPARDVEADASLSPDPFLLRSKLQAEGAISALRKRGGGGKRLGGFYDGQNQEIEALLKPLEQHVEEARLEGEANRLPASPPEKCQTWRGR